jgi:hypothetical protein
MKSIKITGRQTQKMLTEIGCTCPNLSNWALCRHKIGACFRQWRAGLVKMMWGLSVKLVNKEDDTKVGII